MGWLLRRRLRPSLPVSAATAVAACLFLTAPARAAEPPASHPSTVPAQIQSDADEIPRLIAALGSTHPAEREAAARRLIALGPAARPALLEAARDPLPEVAARAAAALRELPWHLPDDPPDVRGLLSGYGAMPPGERQSVASRLYNLRGGAGDAALLRLVVEDPHESVRWQIASAFQQGDRRPPAAQCAPLEAANDNPAALALAGWAHLPTDYARGIGLFERAVAADAALPAATRGRGQLDFVFEVLIDLRLVKGENDVAAALLRRQYARDPGTRESLYGDFNRLDDLLALHADRGPLPGFAADVLARPLHLTRPQALYALARLCERRGWRRAAVVVERVALLRGAGSPARRQQTADYLTARHWDRQAERELKAILASPAAPWDVCSNAEMDLGLIASHRGDDAAAARYLRAALMRGKDHAFILARVRGERRLIGKEAEDDLWGQVHHHELRAALAAGDEAAALEAARQLSALTPYDADRAIDAVPVLKSNGMQEEAERLFDAAYAAARRWLDGSPDDPERLNNFAWLCARCGERLDEALEAAARAVELRPDSAAIIDTLAEVRFRRGERSEAIELAERAVALRPDEPHFRQQLLRFREGEARGTAAPAGDD